MKTYYKFLRENGVAPYGSCNWHLPNGDEPAEWMPLVKDIALCKRGYHVCEKNNLRDWKNETCYIVEVRGNSEVGDNKSVHAQARIIKSTKFSKTCLRLYAADCVERASKYIKDKEYKETTFRTIQVIRAFAFDLVSLLMLKEVREKQEKSCRMIWNTGVYTYAVAVAYAANADAAHAANADAYAAYAAYADANGDAEKERVWQNNRLEEYILGKVDLEKMKVEMVEWLKTNGGK